MSVAHHGAASNPCIETCKRACAGELILSLWLRASSLRLRMSFVLHWTAPGGPEGRPYSRLILLQGDSYVCKVFRSNSENSSYLFDHSEWCWRWHPWVGSIKNATQCCLTQLLVLEFSSLFPVPQLITGIKAGSTRRRESATSVTEIWILGEGHCCFRAFRCFITVYVLKSSLCFFFIWFGC